MKSEKLNESSMKNFPPSKNIIEEPKKDESQKFEDKTQKNDYKPSENAVDDQSNFNEFTINEWVYLKFSNIKFSSKNLNFSVEAEIVIFAMKPSPAQLHFKRTWPNAITNVALASESSNTDEI